MLFFLVFIRAGKGISVKDFVSSECQSVVFAVNKDQNVFHYIKFILIDVNGKRAQTYQHREREMRAARKPPKIQNGMHEPMSNITIENKLI